MRQKFQHCVLLLQYLEALLLFENITSISCDSVIPLLIVSYLICIPKQCNPNNICTFSLTDRLFKEKLKSKGSIFFLDNSQWQEVWRAHA